VANIETADAPNPTDRAFEKAVGAGCAGQIADKEQRKLLLTKEFLRTELDAWDYRSPGGKVSTDLRNNDELVPGNGDMLWWRR